MSRKDEAKLLSQLLIVAAAVCLFSLVFFIVWTAGTAETRRYDDLVPLPTEEFRAQGIAEFPETAVDEFTSDAVRLKADYSLTGLGLVKIDVLYPEDESVYISLLPAEDARDRAPGESVYDRKLKPHGSSGVFSLTHGSGEYELCVWIQKESIDELRSNYQRVYQRFFTASFAEEEPYSYSNANSVFEEDSLAAAYAHALIADLGNDMDRAAAIIAFVHERIEYNEDTSDTEENIMSADEILEAEEGFCYHFAGLSSAMLKSVGIPAKEVRGLNKKLEGTHAWCEVLVDGYWLTADPTLHRAFPLDPAGYEAYEHTNPHN